MAHIVMYDYEHNGKWIKMSEMHSQLVSELIEEKKVLVFRFPPFEKLGGGEVGNGCTFKPDEMMLYPTNGSKPFRIKIHGTTGKICELCEDPQCGGQKFVTECCQDTFCPESLKDYLESQKTMKDLIDIKCSNPDCGHYINTDLITNFTEILTNLKTMREIRSQITDRFRPIQMCPSRHPLQRTRENALQEMVYCSICGNRKMFCNKCGRPGTGNTCNYPSCSNSLVSKNQILSTCSFKVLEGYQNKLKVPETRACVFCGLLITHLRNCKIMTCVNPKCLKPFCFACLKPEADCIKVSGGHYGICSVSPVQQLK